MPLGRFGPPLQAAWPVYMLLKLFWAVAHIIFVHKSVCATWGRLYVCCFLRFVNAFDFKVFCFSRNGPCVMKRSFACRLTKRQLPFI